MTVELGLVVDRDELPSYFKSNFQVLM